MKTTISFSTPNDFDLRNTIYSHGWRELPPFYPDHEAGLLSRVLNLSSGKTVLVSIGAGVTLTVEHRQKLSRKDETEIENQIKDCLRLTEDYESFYAIIGKHKQFAWVGQIKGRPNASQPYSF